MSKVIYKQRCITPSKPGTPHSNRAYLKYIAQRPGSVFNDGQRHGLFGRYADMGQSANIHDLDDALSHVRAKSREKTNVYRAILSIKEEDALPLGYGKREAWEKMLMREMDVIAREMNIPPHRLEWMASVHFEHGHPHAHIMFWDKEQGIKDYFTQPNKADAIRKSLIKDIFHDEFQALYSRKAQSAATVKGDASHVLEALLDGLEGRRDERAARRAFAAISEEYAAGHLLNVKVPEAYIQKVGAAFLSLADIVPTKGRLQYKLMPSEVKERIDVLAREMVSDNPQCRQAMQRYLTSVGRIAGMYSGKPENHKAMRDKAEADLYKDLGNHILRAVKRFQEQAREREHTQEQIRTQAFALLDDFLSFLSRKLDQSEAHRAMLHGELSKQAQIEQAIKRQSRGLDWDR